MKSDLQYLIDAIAALGYTSPRVELTMTVGGYYRDSVTINYTDLMDERHSIYVSAEDDEHISSVFARAWEKVNALTPAKDALRADAAAMVQRTRQKLIDAGFEEETWMAELTAIVKSLGANAITHE